MANKKAVLDKIARNLDMLAIPNSRGSANEVIVDNASNDLTISYIDASIQSPMGGVSDAASPFLGIGIANPGKLKIKSSSTAADTIADVIDSIMAARVLAVCAGMANNIVLENSDATFSGEIRGDVDNLNMGN